MKTFLRYVGALLALAVACQAGLALAGDLRWAAYDGKMSVVADEAAVSPSAPMPCNYSYEDDKPATPAPAVETNCNGGDCGACASCCCCCVNEKCSAWTIDWLVRPYFDSHTSYQFGTPDPAGWAPLSKLDWSLDSTWTGLRIGRENATRGFHFEWLTPMQHDINGHMADFDWITPPGDTLNLLSLTPERWNDGQMIDLGGEFQLTEYTLGMPIEIWPMLGFRWQRFSITGHDSVYMLNNIGAPYPPAGTVIPGDTITFSQQYYMLYVGGQLRTDICLLGRSVDLRFQGDWAGTWGYNVDHHISGYEPTTHRYTMENTSGGAMHVALIAETQLTRYWFIGLSADHLALTTTGSHHWLMTGAQTADQTWTNGVKVRSDQTSITAFLRARF